MRKRIASRIACLVAFAFIPCWLLLSGIQLGSAFQIITAIGGLIVLILFGMLSVQEVRQIESLKGLVEVLKLESATQLAVIKHQDKLIRQLFGAEDHETDAQGPLSAAPISPAPGPGGLGD